MMFTLVDLFQSIAGVLARHWDYPVYISPNQQGTKFPCFFLFTMPSTVEKGMDARFVRDIGIDIVFVQERNIVNGNDEIIDIAEILDCEMELLPYEKEKERAWIRTYERQWQIEDEELHYQFHVREHVNIEQDNQRMEVLEVDDVALKDTR